MTAFRMQSRTKGGKLIDSDACGKPDALALDGDGHGLGNKVRGYVAFELTMLGANAANCESTRAALANARRATRIDDDDDDDDNDDDDDDADDSCPSRLRTLRHASLSAAADKSSGARAPIASHAVATNAESALSLWSVSKAGTDDDEDDDKEDVVEAIDADNVELSVALA